MSVAQHTLLRILGAIRDERFVIQLTTVYVPQFETQEDLDAFKSDQAWSIDEYSETIAEIGRLSAGQSWKLKCVPIRDQDFRRGTAVTRNGFILQTFGLKWREFPDSAFGVSPIVITERVRSAARDNTVGLLFVN